MNSVRDVSAEHVAGATPLPLSGERYRERKGFLAALAALLALGLGLRLANLLGGRGFWLDELYLAQNVFERGFLGFLDPLANEQVAPIGFMLLAELASRLPGEAELTLRLFPFALEFAGLLCLPAVARWAGLTRPGTLVAVAVAALLPTFVRHGPEFKQYGVEIALTIVVTLLAFRVLARPSAPRRAALWLAGAAGALLSMTAPFVLAPAGVLLLARDLRARDWRATAATAATGASWLALFAVSMTIVIAPETQNDMSTRFWTWAFVPVGQPAFAAEWMIRRAFDLFDETVGFHEVGGLALALCLLGIGRMAGERRWTTLALLLGPLACAFLAALAQSYPFHGRLLHFALPGIVILTAAGLVEAASRLSAPAGRDARRRGTALAVTAALALLLILPGARQTLTQAARTTPPFDREGAEVVLERLLARRGPEEVLYLHSKAVAPALRYAEREGLSLAPVIYGHDPLASPEHFLADLEALPEHGRVWVVIGGGWLAANAPTATWASTTVLRQYGEPVERLHHEATKAYLYDFTAAEGARPDIIRRPLPPYHPDQSGDWPDARAD